jgi:hypothetical protein
MHHGCTRYKPEKNWFGGLIIITTNHETKQLTLNQLPKQLWFDSSPIPPPAEGLLTLYWAHSRKSLDTYCPGIGSLLKEYPPAD